MAYSASQGVVRLSRSRCKKGGLPRASGEPRHESRKGKGVKKVLALLTLIASLAVVGAAQGLTVTEGTDSVGNGDIASVTLNDVSRTTAFAIGVWSSVEVAAPVQVQYDVICANPANNRSNTITLLAGRFVSDEAYIAIMSPQVANPWYGWDLCTATVTFRQAAATDHSLIGWLASHDAP